MLFEVYRCVPLNRWTVGVFYIGGRGERGGLFCRYEIRMGLLLVLSWARVRRVYLGRKSSEE